MNVREIKKGNSINMALLEGLDNHLFMYTTDNPEHYNFLWDIYLTPEEKKQGLEKPFIDFDNETLIVVRARHRYGGHKIKVTNVRDTMFRSPYEYRKVIVLMTAPNPRSVIAVQDFEAYHLVAAPKTKLPYRFDIKSNIDPVPG